MVIKKGVEIKKSKKDIKNKKVDSQEINQILIDNFTNLQKVLTNLAVRFDEMSSNMSKLLQLFEISAKSFAEKYSDKNSESQINTIQQTDTEYLRKLDALLDQNKTIAKGIMLMESKIKQRNEPRSSLPESEFGGMIKSKPLPKY
tara:strand:- start:11293 stop:11727 length:435 start_codon:yes stop_codon:yes gene_type:complete